MAFVIADRVKDSTTTTGTGAVTLSGTAPTGFQTFGAAVGNANSTYYCIQGQGTSEWEVGIGTYTAAGTSLSRDTVLSSSNAGSLVNFSAGTKDVFVDLPAARFMSQDLTLGLTSKIQPLPTPTLAGNALTIPSASYTLDFRNATLGAGGAPTTISGAIAALTIPSGATLGGISASPQTIVVLALNNAGTMEYAVVNLAGGNELAEAGIISTTAISATATASNIIYSNSARTNVPYRVIGFFTSTQATAGAWVTAPSLVQGAGGQALQHIGAILNGAITTASGTAVDFTGIPSWVKRVTLVLSGVSLSGSSPLLIQLGNSGAVVTTGYLTNGSAVGAASVATSSYSTGFGAEDSGGNTLVRYGNIIFSNMGNNLWVVNGALYRNSQVNSFMAGAKLLPAALDRLRVTAVNGTDTFTAGSINILYE